LQTNGVPNRLLASKLKMEKLHPHGEAGLTFIFTNHIHAFNDSDLRISTRNHHSAGVLREELEENISMRSTD